METSENARTLFTDEWQAPCKDVHEVGQPVRMGCTIELSDIHHVAFVLQDGRFVVIHV